MSRAQTSETRRPHAYVSSRIAQLRIWEAPPAAASSRAVLRSALASDSSSGDGRRWSARGDDRSAAGSLARIPSRIAQEVKLRIAAVWRAIVERAPPSARVRASQDRTARCVSASRRCSGVASASSERNSMSECKSPRYAATVWGLIRRPRRRYSSQRSPTLRVISISYGLPPPVRVQPRVDPATRPATESSMSA